MDLDQLASSEASRSGFTRLSKGIKSFEIKMHTLCLSIKIRLNEPVHEISNNVVCANSKASDQPARMGSLIRVFASRLSIL